MNADNTQKQEQVSKPIESDLISKEDIATIMRQTECYDVKLIKKKFIENNMDTLDTIFDIMNMKEEVEEPKNDFDKMRNILNQKEELYFQAMKKFRVD
jgi:galactitol-specific phosphotransferase system IIB component